MATVKLFVWNMPRQIFVAIALAICVAALSVAYYFADYLPRTHDAERTEQRRRADFDLAERCRTDGLKFFDKYYAENNDSRIDFRWDAPEFHYSSKLNTCLAHIRYVSWSPGPAMHFNQVVDVYGNRPILFGWFERNESDGSVETLMSTPDAGAPKIPNYTSTKYFTEMKKLFSE